MKQKLLLLLITLLSATVTIAQVSAGQVDDFQDGTVQDWIIGPAGTNVPTNEVDSGPAGVGDNCLRYVTTGNPGGPGSKMVIYNDNGNWNGNYTSAGIVSIQFNAKATTNDLNLRVAFDDGGGNQICTTNGVSVVAGAGWTYVEIPISASDFTLLGGGDIATILTSVDNMRILSNNTPTWVPSALDAGLDIDNITASTTLSLNNATLDRIFNIYPNPGRTKMNISIPTLNSVTKLEVYNVLGKRVYSQVLNKQTTGIDVSRWNSGIYLIKVSNDASTQTKRFVKQ